MLFCFPVKSENLLPSYGKKRRCLKWRSFAILNFRSPIMGSLKKTSYRSLIETIAINCLVFEKIASLCTHFGDQQTHWLTNRKVKERIVLSEFDPRTTGRQLSMGSHSVYLPPDRDDHPAFTPTGQVDTRFIDPVRMKGWVCLVGWLHTEMVYPSNRRSFIPVLTGSDVAPLRWSRPTRYHQAKPPTKQTGKQM